MTFETIKKNSAVDQVTSQLLARITDKSLSAGSRLPSQRDLATQLGVGRSSIREAVNALVVRGYLEPIQGKGTFVKESLPESGEQLEKLSSAVRLGSHVNLMEARVLLECESAALAASRADDNDMERLEAIFATIDPENPDYSAFLQADMDLHIAIAETTKNDILCEMTRLLLLKLAEHHAKLQTEHLSLAYKRSSTNTAGKLLQAIREREPEQASFWMAEHLSLIENDLDQLV